MKRGVPGSWIEAEEEVEEAVVINGESIDVDEELGLKDENDSS